LSQNGDSFVSFLIREGPVLRERGFLFEKGGVTGEGRMKRVGGEGPESPHFIDGKFLSPFISSPRGSGSGKGERKELTLKQSLEFSLIRTGLAIK